MNYEQPHLITFPKHGESAIGYISVADNNSLPFKVERIFWTYFTPESIVRGRHAHFKTEQILIAASGRIIVTTENGAGQIETFILDSPEKGVYIPPSVWHTMQYTHSSIQVVLASTHFDEKDYIREYEMFKKTWGQ